MTITIPLIFALSIGALDHASMTYCTLGYVARSRATVEQCIACHDGSAAPAVPFRLGMGAKLGASHPVAVPLGEGGATGLRAMPLDPRLVLSRGLVACTTCHAGEGGYGRARLAVPASQLCIGCHDL